MSPVFARSRRWSSIRLAAVATTIAIACTACGGQTGTDASPPDGLALGLIKSGVLSVAFRADDKPASFLQDGKATGMYVDLMDEIAKRLNLTTTYVSSDFASLLPSVRNHRYDTAAFGVLVTPEREEVTNFTTAVSYGEAQLISPYGSWEAVHPWTRGFSVSPGKEVTLRYHVQVPTTTRRGTHWWTMVKLMYFGRLHYTSSVPVLICE